MQVASAGGIDREACGFAVATRQTESSPSRKSGCSHDARSKSPLKDGGREGIRTPGLLIANSGENKLRQGATIT
jgi:hypothetical protein